MKYAWLYIPGLVLICMPLIAALLRSLPGTKSSRLRAYYDVTNRCGEILFCGSPERVFGYMEEYEAAFASVESLLPKKERAHYHADMRELREYLADLEQDAWIALAQPHLQDFMDAYYSLKYDAATNPPEYNRQLKRECICEWQAYYAIPLEGYHTRILPSRYFRENLDDEYDDCMRDRTALERRLDSFIRSAKA